MGILVFFVWLCVSWCSITALLLMFLVQSAIQFLQAEREVPNDITSSSIPPCLHSSFHMTAPHDRIPYSMILLATCLYFSRNRHMKQRFNLQSTFSQIHSPEPNTIFNYSCVSSTYTGQQRIADAEKAAESAVNGTPKEKAQAQQEILGGYK